MVARKLFLAVGVRLRRRGGVIGGAGCSCRVGRFLVTAYPLVTVDGAVGHRLDVFVGGVCW